MRISIIRGLPAPMIDGFNVSRFRGGQAYNVDSRLGHYLITAGYATRAEVDEVPRKKGPQG